MMAPLLLAATLWFPAPAARPVAQTIDPRRSGGTQCFLASQYRAWRDQDARTLYVRVNVRDIYRLTSAHPCPSLTYPNAALVLNIDGSDPICTASDWDLRVSRGTGGTDPPIACQVKTMTRLTPSQAAALPPRYRPD